MYTKAPTLMHIHKTHTPREMKTYIHISGDRVHSDIAFTNMYGSLVQISPLKNEKNEVIPQRE